MRAFQAHLDENEITILLSARGAVSLLKERTLE